MDGKGKVSVVIPFYNTGSFLKKCLKSMTEQTKREFEVILVDDGSTDDSSEIATAFSEQDTRFRIIRQENSGPGAARNTGLAQATGDYLIFLDSDDWFERDFLEILVSAAEREEADIVLCHTTQFDAETGKTLPSDWMLKEEYLPKKASFCPGEIADRIFQFTYGWPWDKLYRTQFVKEHGLSFPPLPNSEDLVFVFQSLVMAQKIAVVPNTLVHHRANRKDSVSGSLYKNPNAPYAALRLLKTALTDNRLYETYERSFLNWAMEFLTWNAANITDKSAQRDYFNRLKKEILPEMAFEKHPKVYYTNRFTNAKYQLVKFGSWSVFSAVVKLYKGWKKIRG